MIAYESKMKIFEEIRYFLMIYLNLDFILHWLLVLLISSSFSFQSIRHNFSRTFIFILNYLYWRIQGGAPPARPLPLHGPKFSQYFAVFRKIWQNRMLAPPRGLAPPPTGNPGSAPDMYFV